MNKSIIVLLLQLIQSALTALTIVLLANILSPEDYGRYIFLITSASILPLFTGLGADHIFLMEASRNESLTERLFGNALFIRTILSIVAIACIYILCLLKNVNDIASVLYLYTGALFTVFANPFFLSFYRVKGIHVLPWLICFIAPSSFLLLLFFFLSFKSTVTFNIIALCYFLSNTLVLIIFIFDLSHRIVVKFSWVLLKQNFKTGIFFSLSQVFDYLFQRVDVFIIQFVLGNFSVGIYSAGQKVVNILQIIPSSIHVVELPQLHRLYNNQVELINRFLYLRKILLELSIILFGVMILNAPHIISILFNNQYIGAEKILSILAICNFFFFINYPYYMLGEVINKIKQRMYVRIFVFVLTALLVVFLTYKFKIIGAALGLTLGQIFFFVALHFLTNQFNGGWKAFLQELKTIVVAIIAFVVAYTFNYFIDFNTFLEILFSSIIYLGVFLTLCFFNKQSILLEILIKYFQDKNIAKQF